MRLVGLLFKQLYTLYLASNVTKRGPFVIFVIVIMSSSISATEGTVGNSCKDYHGYIIWRFVFNILVPVSPIALVITISAIVCACSVLACLGDSRDDNQ